MSAIAEKPLSIQIDKKNSYWITVDLENKIISEAPTADEAIKIAETKTKDFILVFVPADGVTYIF